MDNLKIKILGKDFTLKRLHLKGWCNLEGIKKSMDDAISQKDYDQYFHSIVQFIEMASVPSILKPEWDKAPWYEIASAYTEAIKLNTPTIPFPILTSSTDKKEKKLPWEYDGRSWYFWLNLFASNYGWNEETIGGMDIDTAIGLYQEIEIHSQLEKEWEWGLSENAFRYEASTKKSVFQPLPRPKWMLPLAPKFLPVVRMRRDMLPVGNVVDLEAEEKAKKLKSGI